MNNLNPMLETVESWEIREGIRNYDGEIKEQFLSNRLNEVIREINVLKRQLAEIWETKQQTDAEVLALAERLDRLLNEHDRLLQKVTGDKNLFGETFKD